MASRTLDAVRPVAKLERLPDAVGPLTVFLVLLIAIPSRLTFAPLGAAGTPATVVGVCFACWYLFTWLNPAAPLARGRQPIRLAAVLFLCTILATYLSASRHAMSTSELNGLDRGPILVVGWLGVVLVAADGIEDLARLKTLVRRIVAGGTALCVFGIIQATTTFNVAQYIVIPGLSQSAASYTLVRGDLTRPSVTTIQPLEFAGVVGVCLPLAIYLARNAEPGLKRRHWLQVAIIGVASVMTTSRTSILDLIAIGIVLLPAWTKAERRRAYISIVLAGVGLFLTVHGLLGTIKGLFTSAGSDSSTQSRTDAFSSAGQFISQNPWFGRGFGTFNPATYFFTDDQYLNSLIEIGIVGMLVLFALFVTGWCAARSARRASANADVRDLAQCLAAAVAAAAVSFGTFDALAFPMMAGTDIPAYWLCRRGVAPFSHSRRDRGSASATRTRVEAARH